MSPENPALFQNNPDRNVRVGKWIWFRYDGTTPTGKTKYFCVMTQFCARLYGRRAAKNKAKKAMESVAS